MEAKIVNINYKAKLLTPIDKRLYRQLPPSMAVLQTSLCKVIVFKSGKCRLMGLRKPITQQDIENLSVKLILGPIISCTCSINLNTGPLNLAKINDTLKNGSHFEPEIFPALRLCGFTPLCVNVFQSRKCIITGLKTCSIDPILLDKIYSLVSV